MSLFTLALKSARARLAATILTIFAIALSTALVLGVEKIRAGARSGFAQTVSGADMLVGARSGSINLLLYAVFRLGDPTANVSWQTYQAFSRRSDVAWTVPLSLGDSHGGFRVLGTTEAYFTHYRYGDKRQLSFQVGQTFKDVQDAVLGADAAQKLGYQLGEEFAISHGVRSAAFAEHGNHPFKVVGILAPTGTPIDRTIHISLGGMEAVHEGYTNGAPKPIGRASSAPASTGQKRDEPDAITAFIVGLKNKATVLRYQRAVNTYRGEALTGVIPGVALSQLWRVLGPAEQALRAVSLLVVAAGLTGLFTNLFRPYLFH